MIPIRLATLTIVLFGIVYTACTSGVGWGMCVCCVCVGRGGGGDRNVK